MFVSDLCLMALPQPGEWALTRPLIWQGAIKIEVSSGFITDLASIPQVFRNVLSVVGRSRRAAVLHDFLYCEQSLTRAQADDLLRQALVAEGMAAGSARIYWIGVRVGGWVPWDNRLERGGGLERSDFTDARAYRFALASASIDAHRP